MALTENLGVWCGEKGERGKSGLGGNGMVGRVPTRHHI